MSDDKRRVYKLRLEDKGPWCVYDSLNELKALDIGKTIYLTCSLKPLGLKRRKIKH